MVVMEISLLSLAGFRSVVRRNKPMKSTIFAKCLLASTLVVLLSGCLTQETVTSNGEVISQDYVIKRPLKDAIENSENQ